MKTDSFLIFIRRASVLLILINILLMGACGSEPDYSEEAKAHADNVYDRLRQTDYQGAAALYSSKFYERVPRERWLQTLSEIEDNIGRYRQHTLIQARTQTYGPEDNPGEVFTVLMYRVNYDDDEAIEQLVFSTRNSPIELVNHQLVANRIAFRFDDPDDTIRIASRNGVGTGAPETSGDEPDSDSENGEAVAEVVESERIERETPIEERIVAELSRLTAPGQTPETRRFVEQLRVSAIAPKGNRVIVEGRLLKEGESVGQQFPVRLMEVGPRRIIFLDVQGAEYEKWFLSNGR